MFESKINRGKANGYAPLDGDGKVSLSHLPDVVGQAGTSGTSGVNGTSGTSVFADSNSLATTGSNVFTGTQTISGSGDSSLTIGEVNTIAGPSFGLRVSGSDGAPLFVTSDGTLLIGAITNPTNPSDDASFFANQLISFPISDGPTAGILVQKSGSFQSNWVFDYDGKSYFPSDITIGYNSLGSGLTSGSLNITKGNINVSGSLLISGGIQFNDGSTQTTAWVADGISSTSTETVEVNDISTGDFENRGQITVSYTAYNGDAGLSFTADYQSPLTNQSGINVLAIKFPDETIQTTAFIPTTFVTTSSFNEYTSSFVRNSQTSSFVTNSQTSSFVRNSQTSSFVTKTNVPTSSSGSLGDIAGMFAMDSTAMYYCTRSWSGGTQQLTSFVDSYVNSGLGSNYYFSLTDVDLSGWNSIAPGGAKSKVIRYSTSGGDTLLNFETSFNVVGTGNQTWTFYNPIQYVVTSGATSGTWFIPQSFGVEPQIGWQIGLTSSGPYTITGVSEDEFSNWVITTNESVGAPTGTKTFLYSNISPNIWVRTLWSTGTW